VSHGSTGLTIGRILRNAARAVPHRPAAAIAGEVLTFAEVDAQADRLAQALTARGLRRGDRVLCWTGTTLDAVPLFAALARIGAIYCPLPGTLGATEAQGIIQVADPALLVVDAEHAGGLGTLPARSPAATLSELTNDAAALSAEPFPDQAREDDPHVLFFTSGSTGRPKGVILTHRVNYLRSHPGSQVEPRGAMVCVYPLFHMGAWTIALQQWQARDLVVFVPRPDGPAICAAVRKFGATRLNAMPALWRRVLDALECETGGSSGVLPELRFADSGTSATPPDLLASIARACPNAFLRVFYGSTEAGNVASLTGDDVHAKPGSCGVPGQATEVRVDSETGELCVRGPLLFSGYFGDPAATDAALPDGWYHTGDAAKVDEDGYLSIVGRRHDVIRTGGESVVPSEVEAVLAGLPGAAEVAIVGLPDETWGEIVCAVVVPDGGAGSPSLADARRWCEGRLASHKHPRQLRLVDALPRTPATGQLQRRLLVQSLAGPATTDPEEES
jgi:acyl-CoA synthetase (AMP-forming)/AMP-acid ligase II